MKDKFIYCICFLLSLFLLLPGCEYELGENYMDIEDPLKDVKMDISLNLLTNEEGQLLVTDSRLIGYQIIVPFTVRTCIFRLGNKSWKSEGANGQFQIDANQFPNNIYELSCEVYGKPGYESIFDQVGSDICLGKESWPLRILTSDPSDRVLSFWINGDGFNEISWEIDEKYRTSFHHYEVIASRSNAKWIYRLNKFDQSSFVDRGQQSAPVTYEVYYYPKEVTGRPFSLGKVVV